METSFSPLTWYKNIEEQNHRRWYAYGHVHQLCMPLGTILPFQFVRGAKPTEIVSVTLNSLDGDNVIDITTAMFNSGLTLINKYNGYGFDVINYTSDRALSVSVKEGLYYLTISDNVGVFYSEVFAFVADTSRLLRIEWENYEDMIYNDGITLAGKSVLYLNTELGKPEYTFEEEGTDRDGLFFPEKQLSEKLYKFTFMAPEYLCDSLRLAQMADVVTITDKYGRNYNCDTFHIAVEWQDQGDLAAVEAEFTTSTVLKKVGNGSSAANGEDAPNYLTFTYVKGSADNANQVVNLSVEPTIAEKYGWEFSGDGGRSWFEAAWLTINVAAVDKLMVRGYGCYNRINSAKPIFTITGGKVEASGSVTSLFEGVLSKDVHGRYMLPPNHNMAYMFSNCSSLVTAPEIPFSVLQANSCCEGMFQYCTSLVTAPELPARYLANYCYVKMFQNCESLLNAPKLPATELEQSCYKMMFQHCESLVTAPELPATTLASYCYQEMFYGCTSLVTAPALPATTLADSCYLRMFGSCTSLVTAPELPATTLADRCYYYMFYGCTSLVTVPELPATALVTGCYQSMLRSCPKLSSVTVKATSWNTTFANYWLGEAGPTGTVRCYESAGIPLNSASGVPSGWTVEYLEE